MRLSKCSYCGRTFEASGSQACCPECRSAARGASALRERVCADCGITFQGYPKSKRCPDCQHKRNLEKAAIRRKIGSKRVLGQEYPCESCGKPYILYGPLQKYCPECAPQKLKENVNAHKRAYMLGRVEIKNQQKKALKEDCRICLWCGKAYTPTGPAVTCSPTCADSYDHYVNSRFTRAECITEYPRKSGMSYIVCVFGKHVGTFHSLKLAIEARDKCREEKEKEKKHGE